MKTLFRICVLSTVLVLGVSHPYNYYQPPGYYHQQWRHQPDARTQYLPPDHEWSMRSYPLPGQPYPAPEVVNYQQVQSYPVYPDAFPSGSANAPVYPVQETSHSHIIKKVIVPATRGSQIIDLSPDGDEQDVKIIQVKPKNDGTYDDRGLPDVVKEALMRFLANDKNGHNNQTSPAFTIIAHEDAIAQNPERKSKHAVRPKPVHHHMIQEQHHGRRPSAQKPKTDTIPVNKADKITVVATGDNVKAIAIGDNIEAIATGKNSEAVVVSSNAKAKAVVDGKPDNLYITSRVTKHPLQTTPTSFDKPTPVRGHKPVPISPSHNANPILKHIPLSSESDKSIPEADDCNYSDAKTTAKEVKPTPEPTLTPTPIPVHKPKPTHAPKPTTSIVEQKPTTVIHVPVIHKSDKPIPVADNYNYSDDIIAPTKEVKPTPESTFKPTPIPVHKQEPTHAPKPTTTHKAEQTPTTVKPVPITHKSDKPIPGADDYNYLDNIIEPTKEVKPTPAPTLTPTPDPVHKQEPTHASKPTTTHKAEQTPTTVKPVPITHKSDKPMPGADNYNYLDDIIVPTKEVKSTSESTFKRTPVFVHKQEPTHAPKPTTTHKAEQTPTTVKPVPITHKSDKPISVADNYNYSDDIIAPTKEVKPTPVPTLTPTPVPVHKQEPTHASKPTTTNKAEQKPTTVKPVSITHKSDKTIPGTEDRNAPDTKTTPVNEVKQTSAPPLKPPVNKPKPTHFPQPTTTPIVEQKPTTVIHVPVTHKSDKPIPGADNYNSTDDTIAPAKEVKEMLEPTLKPTPFSVHKHVPTHASRPTLTPVNDIVNYTPVNNKFDKPVDDDSDSSDDNTLPDKAVTHKTTHSPVGRHNSTPTILNDTPTSLPVTDDYNSSKDTTSPTKDENEIQEPTLKPTEDPVHKHVPTSAAKPTIAPVVEHKPTPIKHTPINPTSNKSIPKVDDSDSSNDATSQDEAVKKPTLRPVEQTSSTSTIVNDTPPSLADDYGSPEGTTSPTKAEKEIQEPTFKPTAIPVHKHVPTSAVKPTVAPVVEHKPTHVDHIVNDTPINPKPDKSMPVDDDFDSSDKTTLLAIEVKPTTKPTPTTTSAPVHKHAPTLGPKSTLIPAEEPNPTVTSKPEKPSDVTTSPDETVKDTPGSDHKSKTDSVTHKPSHATKPTPNSKTPETDPPVILKSTEKPKLTPTVKPTRASTEIYKPTPVDSTAPDDAQTTSTTTKPSPPSDDSDMDIYDDTYPKSEKENDFTDFVIICSNPFIPMDDCADQLIKVIPEEPFTTPVDKNNKDPVPDHSCVDDKINNNEIDDSKKVIKNDAADTKEVKIEKDFDDKTSNTEVRKLTNAFNPINKPNTEDGAHDELKSGLDKKSRGTDMKNETITNDIGKSDTKDDNLKKSDSDELYSEKHVDVITSQLDETNKEVKHKETETIDKNKTIDTDDECDQEASVSQDALQNKSDETAKKDLDQTEIVLTDKDDKISKTEPNLIAYILSLIKNVLSNDDALKEIIDYPDVQKTVKRVSH